MPGIILLTLAGMVMLFKFSQYVNINILSSWTLSGTVNSFIKRLISMLSKSTILSRLLGMVVMLHPAIILFVLVSIIALQLSRES